MEVGKGIAAVFFIIIKLTVGPFLTVVILFLRCGRSWLGVRETAWECCFTLNVLLNCVMFFLAVYLYL